MLKKIFILLCCLNLYATNDGQASCKLSTTQKALILGSLGTGAAATAIFFGPVILSAGTIAAIKATAAAAAVKATAAGAAIKTTAVAAAPIAGGISMGLSGARVIRPYVFPTSQEELNGEKQQDASVVLKTKTDLRSCLIKNKCDRNAPGIPSTCEEVAFMFAMLEGQNAVDKMVSDLNK